jgi:hypothetical protein
LEVHVKSVLSVLLILAALFGLTWAVEGNDFFLYRYFAPKREAVRRQVFEQTKSYTQGMIQELQNMQFEYAKANPDQQKALASIILHRAADFDESRLPPDLATFIRQLKTEQGGLR